MLLAAVGRLLKSQRLGCCLAHTAVPRNLFPNQRATDRCLFELFSGRMQCLKLSMRLINVVFCCSEAYKGLILFSMQCLFLTTDGTAEENATQGRAMRVRDTCFVRT